MEDDIHTDADALTTELLTRPGQRMYVTYYYTIQYVPITAQYITKVI